MQFQSQCIIVFTAFKRACLRAVDDSAVKPQLLKFALQSFCRIFAPPHKFAFLNAHNGKGFIGSDLAAAESYKMVAVTKSIALAAGNAGNLTAAGNQSTQHDPPEFRTLRGVIGKLCKRDADFHTPEFIVAEALDIGGKIHRLITIYCIVNNAVGVDDYLVLGGSVLPGVPRVEPQFHKVVIPNGIIPFFRGAP